MFQHHLQQVRVFILKKWLRPLFKLVTVSITYYKQKSFPYLLRHVHIKYQFSLEYNLAYICNLIKLDVCCIFFFLRYTKLHWFSERLASSRVRQVQWNKCDQHTGSYQLWIVLWDDIIYLAKCEIIKTELASFGFSLEACGWSLLHTNKRKSRWEDTSTVDTHRNVDFLMKTRPNI